MIRFRSIRARLTFWYTSLVAAALTLSGLTSYYLTRSALYENLDTSLQNELQWLREFIEPQARKVPLKRSTVRERQRLTKTPQPSPEQITDEELWDEVFRHTLYKPHQQIIQILDRNGDVLYQSPILEGRILRYDDVPLGTTVITTIQDDDGRELRLAITQSEFVKIFVASSLDEVNRMLNDIANVRLFVSPLTVIIALLGGLVLAHRLSKPVNDLAMAAEQVNAQNLTVQLPVRDSQDEVGRMTETFNKMIQRLHASFQEIQQFSAEASHELRTPLTIMRGEIEVALRNRRLTKGTRELLRSIHDELVRLSGIVENLMTLVKSTSGRLIFKMEDIQLETVLSEVADDARLLANNKKIKVLFDPRESVTIAGDTMRLRQLFLNLLDNAVKFTPPHGTIVLGLERRNGYAVVSVKDSGIGIPRKHHEKIFERFYRVPHSQQAAEPGSGLGLSIAKWIVEAHDGTIKVKSREKRGSTFIVTLPLAPSSRTHVSSSS